ncbi:uridine kinase [Aminobacter sp. HY435]|uniref:uridine kinase n=1 Tax=Aminobacter sp. HY435 TaxID=2970917 RepID=UPI0022B9760E|nr:uridine kinase [Aminobacter sp. HY435]
MTAPIVAISGHPGGGKTTLTRALAGRLGVPSLHYDDYETMTSRPPSEVRDWMARGSDYDEIGLDRLVVALTDLSRRTPAPKVILLDTLLGRAHRQSGQIIDLLVWIDTPPDIALARKVAEAAARAAPAEASSFVGWLRSYLDHYQGFISGSYMLQRERVRPGADIVLDGCLAPDELADLALSSILARI